MNDLFSPRLILALLLLAATAAVGAFHPLFDTDEPAVHSFEFDRGVCEPLRAEREMATYAVADDATVTWGEVAERFDVEPLLVCKENDQPADCATTLVPTGTTVRLPLDRRPGAR